MCTVTSMDISTPPPPEVAPNRNGWRTVSLFSWTAVLGAVIAVAISSRTIGRAVWWLGPPANPATPLFLLIPIALVVLPLLAWYRRHVSAHNIDLACAIALVLISAPDFADRPGTAFGMLVVGIAALMQSIAVRVATRHYR